MCREINLKNKYRYFFNIRTVILAIPAILEQTILAIPNTFGRIKKYTLISNANSEINTT